MQHRDSVARLRQVVARLREEGGCDWDRAQTPRSMVPYLLEETWEVVEAIEAGGLAQVREEAGDLLFHVVMLSRMAEEQGAFDLDDVADGIRHKLVRRHPSVFSPGEPEQGQIPGEPDADRAERTWNQVKSRERGPGSSILDGIPKGLPALLLATRTAERAGRTGFDWPDMASVRAKVDEEATELDQAIQSGDPAAMEHELGDLLLAVANLGRKMGLDPESALRSANRRFERRFRAIESLARTRGCPLETLSLDELDGLWEEAKGAERRGELP